MKMTGLVYDRFLADEEERKEMQKIRIVGGVSCFSTSCRFEMSVNINDYFEKDEHIN